MLFNFFKKRKYQKIINEAEGLLEEGKVREAIEKYEEAFDIIINVNDFIKVACMYIDLKEYEKGIQIFNQILEHCDETGVSINGMCDVYFGLAVAYDCLRQINNASEYYEKAIGEGILVPECYYFCACLYDEMDLGIDDPLTQKALKYYEKAIELNNEYLFAYVNLGTMYAKFNKDEKCLECFLKAKELDKDNSTNIDYNLGVAYGHMGDFKKAEYYYLEELKLDDPFESTYYNLGILYKDMKEYEKAKYYYLKAIEKDKEELNAWYNLACLYSLMKDYDNALECFTYIKYKKKNLINCIADDDELVEFRNSDYMKRLLD